jgi:hypothetical protein
MEGTVLGLLGTVGACASHLPDDTWHGHRCSNLHEEGLICVALDADRKKHGPVISKRMVGWYNHGQRYGQWIGFHDDPSPNESRTFASVGRFVGGVEHGSWKYFYSWGELACTVEYEHGTVSRFDCPSGNGGSYPNIPSIVGLAQWRLRVLD